MRPGDPPRGEVPPAVSSRDKPELFTVLQTIPQRRQLHAPALSLAFIALICVLTTVSVVHFRVFLINHDVAYFLAQSLRMAGGAKLYIDIVDFNPPMIHFWGLLPVLVSRFTNLSLIAAFYGFASLALILTLWLCHTILKRIYPAHPAGHNLVLTLLIAVCVVPLAFEHFGQREHFFFAFFLPYLLAAHARVAGRELGAGHLLPAGLILSIGICFKPYFLLPVFAVEIFLLLRLRGAYSALRPELISASAVTLIYLGVIWFAYPAYFDCVVLARSLYSGYNASFHDILFTPPVYCFLAVVLILCLVRVPAKEDLYLFLLLAVVMAAFLLMAVIQQKGWQYHYYPLIAMEFFFAGVFLIRRCGNWRLWKALRLGVEGCVLAALFGFSIVAETSLLASSSGPSSGTLMREVLLRAVTKHAGGRSMFVFSTSMFPAWPLVLHSGSSWPYRHPSLWFLPKIYQGRDGASPDGPIYNPPSKMDHEEKLLFSQVISDLEQHPPALIMVDKSSHKQGLSGPFNFLEYFSQDEGFSKLLDRYRLVDRFAEFDLFVPGESLAAGNSR